MPETPAQIRKRRWFAAIAAALAALFTTLTESVIIGETVGDVIVSAVD